MNIQITEGRLPYISPVALTDEIDQVANFVWVELSKAITKARAAVTNLDECLYSSGVEDASTLLDEMHHNLCELCDRIEAQKALQIEYRRGDR